MKLSSNGSGSDKFEIDQVDMGGWVRIHVSGGNVPDGVKVDPSVPRPEPETGHDPPNCGARVVSEYEITCDHWEKPTFKKIEGK